MEEPARRLPAWTASGLAASGVAAELAYAGWAYFDARPTDGLAVAASMVAVGFLVVVGLLGVLPALLLWKPSTRRLGSRVALGLGITFTVLLFWLPEGILLLAAAAVSWPRRLPPTAAAPFF